jgi:hypothetical protein
MELGSMPAGTTFLTQPPTAAHAWDDDAVGVDAASQATLLLRRRKAVSDAEAELSARKAATRARMAELDERAARLAAKRGALAAELGGAAGHQDDARACQPQRAGHGGADAGAAAGDQGTTAFQMKECNRIHAGSGVTPRSVVGLRG